MNPHQPTSNNFKRSSPRRASGPPEAHGNHSQERICGVCKWFDPQKSYGFITSDVGDVFVHFKKIIAKSGEFKTLEKGERVSFTVVETEKGLSAENVMRNA